jgi:hypothetical protein
VPLLWRYHPDGTNQRYLPVPAPTTTLSPRDLYSPGPALRDLLATDGADRIATGTGGHLWLASDAVVLLLSTGGA